MMHAILTLLFIFVLTRWLRYEYPKKRVDALKHWQWIAAAGLFQIFASILSVIFEGTVGNFLLHMIGGGVASAFMFGYLLSVLKLRVNWRVEIVLLYAFVSALGILNELAEYGAEFFGLGPFSLDAHDTWRDFVANTSGALIAWALIKVALLTKKDQPND